MGWKQKTKARSLASFSQDKSQSSFRSLFRRKIFWRTKEWLRNLRLQLGLENISFGMRTRLDTAEARNKLKEGAVHCNPHELYVCCVCWTKKLAERADKKKLRFLSSPLCTVGHYLRSSCTIILMLCPIFLEQFLLRYSAITAVAACAGHFLSACSLNLIASLKRTDSWVRFVGRRVTITVVITICIMIIFNYLSLPNLRIAFHTKQAIRPQ